MITKFTENTLILIDFICFSTHYFIFILLFPKNHFLIYVYIYIYTFIHFINQYQPNIQIFFKLKKYEIFSSIWDSEKMECLLLLQFLKGTVQILQKNSTTFELASQTTMLDSIFF